MTGAIVVHGEKNPGVAKLRTRKVSPTSRSSRPRSFSESVVSLLVLRATVRRAPTTVANWL